MDRKNEKKQASPDSREIIHSDGKKRSLYQELLPPCMDAVMDGRNGNGEMNDVELHVEK